MSHETETVSGAPRYDEKGNVASDKITYCCISPGQHSAFRGSTGVPKQCFGAPTWVEQRYNGLEKYKPSSHLHVGNTS